MSEQTFMAFCGTAFGAFGMLAATGASALFNVQSAAISAAAGSCAGALFGVYYAYRQLRRLD